MKLAITVAVAFGLSGCRNESVSGKTAAPPPAKVQNGGLKESDLAQIVLTGEAERRLGIEVAPVNYGSAAQARTYAGEIVAPPGAYVTASAPVAGTLGLAPGGAPTPGKSVRAGETVFVLRPLAPPERDIKVNVQAEITSAEARVEAARARLARAERMLRDQVGSVKAVETAKEDLAIAETALEAARAKLAQIEKAPLDAGVSIRVTAPHDGLLRQIHAAPGQTVASGAPLFEVARLDTVWIRVPVYTGEAQRFARGVMPEVRSLAGSVISRAARPVAAPPSADPIASTSDLYFELETRGVMLRPGERVSVVFPTPTTGRNLQVPWASIVHDAHGGAWVYESLGDGKYRRRRVDVRNVQNGIAILARGPEPGTRVVTTGAAELFGTEFGAGH